MKLISSLLNNLPKNKKLILVLVLIIITIIVSFSIPTIARRNNRAIINSTPTWDGSIASKYNSGDARGLSCPLPVVMVQKEIHT